MALGNQEADTQEGKRVNISLFLVKKFFILFIYCSLDFQANFELDVPRLCIDFRENIKSPFSPIWQAILRKSLAPRNARLAIALGANVRTLL